MARLNLVKKVRMDFYFRLDKISSPVISLSLKQKKFVKKYSKIVKGNWTLCRLSNDFSSISFMDYNWNVPNPRLRKSIKFTLKPKFKIGKIRNYCINSPILHRSELYFTENSKEYKYYKKNGLHYF